MLKLAERCEQAAGPDRELDAEIAVVALGFFVAEPRYEGAPVAYGYIDPAGSRVEPGNGGKQLIRHFTASLDAAMTLVPEGYGWRLWVSNSEDRMSHGIPNLPGVTMWGNGREYAPRETRAATPALALCAAALRARSA